ncbi:MAG: HD domain-containing protein [Longimicrobiales bacterium]|nr:HD domain-containing protein [Longimicrobiales bacterium]
MLPISAEDDVRRAFHLPMPPLHPLIDAASRGELPEWACASKSRRRHMARVAKLMNQWGKALALPKEVRRRWKAAAHLHDCVKEESPAELRRLLRGGLRRLPDGVLHGPAASVLLRREGVVDEPLLQAVSYHTLGHPDFETIGLALYAADFLEPGRRSRSTWRNALRERAPDDLNGVVHEIVRRRIHQLMKRGRPVRPETIALWNSMAEEEAWVRASAAS